MPFKRALFFKSNQIGANAVRVLFIGDVVGKTGRDLLHKRLPEFKKHKKIDFIFANGENAAGGVGITEDVFAELRRMGVDAVTGGNHIWDRKGILDFIDNEPRMLRPANYPPETTPGRGSLILDKAGVKVGLINLIGRVFMRPVDCPFRAADRELKAVKEKTDIIFIDFHAEATSEKQALGWYLDGQVSAVIGTHSHVQTADERILPGGTAYITDAGMVGLYDSILGVDRDGPLKRFLTQMPHKLEISSGKTLFNGVIVEIDQSSRTASSIERIFEVS